MHIVTVLNGDEQVRDVRVTFSVRHCDAGPSGVLDDFAKTCARENTVPEALYKELVLVGERIEAASRVVDFRRRRARDARRTCAFMPCSASLFSLSPAVRNPGPLELEPNAELGPPSIQADPPAGPFNGEITVTFTADHPATIYLSTNGEDPRTSSIGPPVG